MSTQRDQASSSNEEDRFGDCADTPHVKGSPQRIIGNFLAASTQQDQASSSDDKDRLGDRAVTNIPL